MLREGYEVTSAFEATHWWFLSRQSVFLQQVDRAVRAASPRTPRAQILDYGCGTGFNLSLLATYGDVTGADVAPEALGEFQKGQQFPLIDLRQPLRAHEGRFDVIVALDVIEHFDDDIAGLRDISRLLAPDGQIVLTVPAYQWLWSGEDVISQHRRRYTKRTLLAACRAAGLELCYVSYFNLSILPAVTAVIWARRLLAPQAQRHSNLRPTAPWLNRTLHAVTDLEARWVGAERISLPAGASLVCRLRPVTEAHAAVA